MASPFPSYIQCLRNMCSLLELYPSPITQGSHFGPGDFLQSSLSKTVLEWEARIPEMEIWRTILAWAIWKLRRNDGLTPFEQKKREFHKLLSYWTFGLRGTGGSRQATLDEETQALELILHWIRRDGMMALKRAECLIDDRRVKPTDIDQYIMQLLELMEQEYWRTQYPAAPPTYDPDTVVSVLLRKEIFKTMLEEIPKLIGMHRRLGLRNPTLEARFSTTLDKILRLSSWTPCSTHNKHLHELLRNALQMLNDVGDNEQYHDDLRDFMKRHTAFCAFTLDNAYAITAEDSETTAELCKNLRRLAQNLGKIASTRAEQCQKLYENFIAHREELSHWLDSASLGQGELYI